MKENTSAIFDTLVLCDYLSQILDDVSETEVHLYSYFACLLWLYEGNSVASWQYKYIRNDLGGPFSQDVHNALAFLSNDTIYLLKDGEYFKPSSKYNDKIDFLKKLSIFKKREKYLQTSVNCLEFTSYLHTKEAIYSEPVLFHSNQLKSSRILLDNSDELTPLLYDQFCELHKLYKDDSEELLLPALSWITYLASLKENE